MRLPVVSSYYQEYTLDTTLVHGKYYGPTRFIIQHFFFCTQGTVCMVHFKSQSYCVCGI